MKREKPPCKHCGRPIKNWYPSQPNETCSRACRSALTRTAPPPPPVSGAAWVALGHNRWALIDSHMTETLSRFTWGSGGSANQYACTRVGGKTIYMHHMVRPDLDRVDHRNGNGCDNRRENLRAASQRQNTGNVRSRAKKAPYKGIALQPNGAWTARILMPNGTRPSLGTYATPEEAARAYDVAAREVHGVFACVNFPEEGERGALQ